MTLFLNECFSIATQSPKETFHECLSQRLVSSDEAELLIKIVEDFYATTHTYDEGMSDLIAGRVAAHYKALCIISQRPMRKGDICENTHCS